ncbi:hypothetical protein ACA30_15985 [Virgibacillus soli]|nr:hypothetical protein ACA30_15985 [Virgibacillus soli]
MVEGGTENNAVIQIDLNNSHQLTHDLGSDSKISSFYNTQFVLVDLPDVNEILSSIRRSGEPLSQLIMERHTHLVKP